MKRGLDKLIALLVFCLIIVVGLQNSALAYFGWEDGTTQGWRGNVSNSTIQYYSGNHSLEVNLNLKGKGFKSSQTTLPNYPGKAGDQLSFKVYVPSVPEAPLDLKAQVYVSDSKSNILRSRWIYLLTDRWNDLFYAIPEDFEGPLSIALTFGTELDYTGHVYIDQSQAPFKDSPPKENYSNNVNPAAYNTYMPLPAGGGLQLVPAAQLAGESGPRRGGFGTPLANGTPALIGDTSGSQTTSTTTTSTTTTTPTITTPTISTDTSGGEEVIFEHKSFILLSVGLFTLGLRLKRATS